ncbi:chalcone isomerase family protein [Polaromonas sp.]|uniref:chalcone isomerase family protein n=1 Tax=Polaromonas sp. TaxID=1869339 RepID=UPI001DCA1E7E|nr:chalcone isomerase family protein [Polaromonas sp.]
MGVLHGLLRSGFYAGQHQRHAVHAAQTTGLALKRLLLAAAAGLLCAGAALAQSPAATTLEVAGALPQGQLIGQGRLTVWGFQVYDARLWAATGFGAGGYASQPMALELAYLRAFDAVEVAKRSLQEMRRSAAISEAQAAQWTTELLRVIPDVRKGDRITGVHRPGVGAAFWVNGRASGEIRDAEFARLFFGIWLSPNTSEPQLRQALLAGAGE